MWLHEGKQLEIVPEDAYGFVYLITNNVTGRKYIGKKLFWFKKIKTVKGKRKRIKVESDWRDYWSSSDDVKKDVKELGEYLRARGWSPPQASLGASIRRHAASRKTIIASGSVDQAGFPS